MEMRKNENLEKLAAESRELLRKQIHIYAHLFPRQDELGVALILLQSQNHIIPFSKEDKENALLSSFIQEFIVHPITNEILWTGKNITRTDGIYVTPEGRLLKFTVPTEMNPPLFISDITDNDATFLECVNNFIFHDFQQDTYFEKIQRWRETRGLISEKTPNKRESSSLAISQTDM